MEREKTFLGWKCKLSPEELEAVKTEFLLKDYLKEWKVQPDGTATLRVAPWKPNSWIIMEMFMEGLREYEFQTMNVEKVGSVEIVEREY